MTTTPKTSRRLLRLAIALPVVALIWYFVGKSLIAGFRKIDWPNLHVSWPFLAASLLSLLCARLTNALNARQVLAAMGQDVSARQVVPVIWVASLGRYIPGKLAVVAGAVAMLMRLGIRLPVAAAALFLSTALMILIGLIASAPLMFTPAIRQLMPNGWLVSLILLALGLVGLHPRVFTRLCNLALQKLKRQSLPHRLATGPFLRAIAMTLLRTTFLGLALFFAARAFAPLALTDFPLTFSSAGLASVAGFLAVFAPAGLGVHEGVYLLTLSPLLGPNAALLVLLFRFLNLLADALTGGSGMLLMPTPSPDENAALETAVTTEK